jgi:hypothetical protein
LDLLTTVGAVYALANGGALDAGTSLSSGALIFIVRDEFNAWRQPAAAIGGVIIHRDRLNADPNRAGILADSASRRTSSEPRRMVPFPGWGCRGEVEG